MTGQARRRPRVILKSPTRPDEDESDQGPAFRPSDRRRRVSNEKTIRIMCPNLGCQRILAVPVHARGKLVRCRSCAMTIRIPAKGQAGQEADSTESAA